MLICVVKNKNKLQQAGASPCKARIGLNTTEVNKVPHPQPDPSSQQSDL